MSVYEYLKVENTREYSKKKILKQFLGLGCIEFLEDYDDYEYIKTHGIIQSSMFINGLNQITRVPFCLPDLRSDKKVYNILSCNKMPLPFVVFEWVRRHFPGTTRVYYEIETSKLFSGQINNYFKTRKIRKDWFEKEQEHIKLRKELHSLNKR